MKCDPMYFHIYELHSAFFLFIRRSSLYNYNPLKVRVSLVTQTVMNLLTICETRVRSLGREEPLEKGMETHSSVLAWRIAWTEEPGGLQSMGSQRVGHD